MGIEQLDNEERYRKEKESRKKERNELFYMEKNIHRKSSELLKKLAQEIADEFWLDVLEVQKMINGETLSDLDDLKSSVAIKEKIDSSKFQTAIDRARKQVEDLSKKYREELKQFLEEESYEPEKHEYHFHKLLPPGIVDRAENPKNIPDQILWLGLWIIDSTEAVILFTYGLGKWILLTPLHLYQIITGEREYTGWKNL